MRIQEKAKYYVLNKEMDYRRGYMQGVHCEGAYLWTNEQERLRGVFISRVFDSGENGTIWHRLQLEKQGDYSTSLRMHFFASDDPYVIEDGQAVWVEDIIHRPAEQMDIEQKKQCFAPFLQKDATDPESMLLHQVKGRYFWFMAEIYCLEGQAAGIGNIMIYFPKQTWIKYLPEVYDREPENDTFLERYLSIFQTLYDHLSREIDEIPRRLDTEATDIQTLKWMAQWLGIQNVQLWTPEQLRYLVNHGIDLYSRRGTKEGIRDFIELYTGEPPLLIEQYEIERYADNEWLYPLLKDLYGDDPYVFTVLVRESCLPAGRNVLDLRKIIDEVKPAWMDFRIVTLRPYILLDSYSYLGINSVLGQYRAVELDGVSMLSFSAVGEDKPDDIS